VSLFESLRYHWPKALHLLASADHTSAQENFKKKCGLNVIRVIISYDEGDRVSNPMCGCKYLDSVAQTALSVCCPQFNRRNQLLPIRFALLPEHQTKRPSSQSQDTARDSEACFRRSPFEAAPRKPLPHAIAPCMAARDTGHPTPITKSIQCRHVNSTRPQTLTIDQALPSTVAGSIQARNNL
jgi:hypothetical protein